ncbi:TetR/AcrR family transcriptional regulator [Neptuniibacter caesariensis]|uniref:Transcriptional regulator n=1 Tax=Neptuniibacter caesariensis TaxID=207954 RepID=A0A7U8C5F8_NEPCE|nr:TetR/AcrR family transcriptional regulator [Neptuniibacter caesariensis]EAR61823.1 transcriptional regulator [Neptuniibacter caesariensis]
MAEKKLSRSELKRKAILDAAKESFQENGVQGTSMDQLAARAQVSKRTVYNHFTSKEALVIHLVADLWKQATQSIELNFDAEGDLQTQLSSLLQAEMNVVCSTEYLDLARVAIGHYFYHPEALQAELSRFDKTETALYRWLETAIDNGHLKKIDPSFAINQLHSLIKGNCFWPQLLQVEAIPSLAERQHLADESAAMFLNYYQH